MRAVNLLPSEQKQRSPRNKLLLAAEQSAGRTRRKALEGLLWATLVSKEFQLNH